MRVEKFGNVGSRTGCVNIFLFWLWKTAKTEFLGIQLYCPSSWQIEILCKDDDTLTIAGGIADRDFWPLDKKN